MIVDRIVPASAASRLEAAGLHPVLARVLAGRGVNNPAQLSTDLAGLHPPALMRGLDEAATLLADAIEAQAALLVIADYDCDGATACAVAIRGLRMMGAHVDYLVPNRFETGYGLTPELVELALKHPRLGTPDLLLTVDNGIASLAGARAAQDAGLALLITDHHLPGPELPSADAIVNPNAGGCRFPSKSIAGVGVMFYVLIALRAELRNRGADGADAPLAQLLDLVALGTVADVVRLDPNNRLLVAQGLKRIRGGKSQPGLQALFAVAAREARSASAQDLGFAIAPRINAAGRLGDMSIGIECLLADQHEHASSLAQLLNELNQQRRDVESGMQAEALAALEFTTAAPGRSIVVSQPDWHQGVIGLVAGKLKERFHRPVIALAPASTEDDVWLRGSGRSIPGVHLRDCLDLVAKRLPQAIDRFGGHAMAAGLTLRADALEAFTAALEQAIADLSDPAVFVQQLETDGELDPARVDHALLDAFEQTVWGQGFPSPSFHSVVRVLTQRSVGSGHLKLSLSAGSGQPIEAIWFGRTQPAPDTMRAVWQPIRNEWQGRTRIELQILHGEPV